MNVGRDKARLDARTVRKQGRVRLSAVVRFRLAIPAMQAPKAATCLVLRSGPHDCSEDGRNSQAFSCSARQMASDGTQGRMYHMERE